MDLDLTAAASFLVLAEELHFGRAAARLHLSTSGLSKQLQRLERQVGVMLIQRDSGGTVAVTAAGKRFARRAAPLLSLASAALDAAQKPPAAVVRLGVPGRLGEAFSRQELVAIGDNVHRRLPDVRVVFVGVPFTLAVAALTRHMVDVMWTTSGMDHPQLEAIPLSRVWRSGLVSAHHELAEAGTVSIDDFVDQPLLYNPSIPPSFMAPGCLSDYRPLSDARLVETTAENMAAILDNTANGLGVSVLPSTIANRIGPRLRALTLVGLPPTELHAVRRRHDQSEPVGALLQILRDSTLGI